MHYQRSAAFDPILRTSGVGTLETPKADKVVWTERQIRGKQERHFHPACRKKDGRNRGEGRKAASLASGSWL